MFGGGYVLDGTLVSGVPEEPLLARVAPMAYTAALAELYTREMGGTGIPMRGLVFVDPPGTATDEALEAWLDRPLDVVGSPAPT